MNDTPLVNAFRSALSPVALRYYKAAPPRLPPRSHRDARSAWLASWVTLAVTRTGGAALDDERAIGVELAGHYTHAVGCDLVQPGVLGPPDLIHLSPVCLVCSLPLARTGPRAPEAGHVDCLPLSIASRFAAVLYARCQVPLEILRTAGISAFAEGADLCAAP